MLVRMFNKLNGPQIPKWIQIEHKQFNEKRSQYSVWAWNSTQINT